MAKKRHSKEGAIELSMTTVIVIILGVVLLTMGLAFVRGIFGKVGGLTESAFEEAEASIGKLGNIENELTLTSTSITLEQGKSKGVGVVMANLGDRDASFQIRTSLPPRTAEKAEFTCFIAETESSQSDAVTISSGDTRPLRLLILDEGDSPIGTYVCKVSLYKDGSLALDSSILINVEA